MAYGPLYANCVLRPFVEQLSAELGDVQGQNIFVQTGDAGVLAAELKRRGANVVSATDGATAAASLATLGSVSEPGIGLAALARMIAPPGAVAALHFTADSRHEAIARAALENVGAASADRWLEPLAPAALQDFTVTTVRDVVRFNSPRQFYAALIAERHNDAGLDAIERQRMLAYCIKQLASMTAFDDTVRISVEALLVVRR